MSNINQSYPFITHADGTVFQVLKQVEIDGELYEEWDEIATAEAYHNYEALKKAEEQANIAHRAARKSKPSAISQSSIENSTIDQSSIPLSSIEQSSIPQSPIPQSSIANPVSTPDKTEPTPDKIEPTTDIPRADKKTLLTNEANSKKSMFGFLKRWI